MISGLALASLMAAPLQANYVRLSCSPENAVEAAFLIDMPGPEITGEYRGDIRQLYHISGADDSFWYEQKPTFVMDSWPHGLFIEFENATLNIDRESAHGPLGYALETAHDHENGDDQHAHGDDHAELETGLCRDITEEALK